MYILEGKNITKSFDGVKIIEDISLNVKEGEIVSLLGVSGVGKTTLFNIISGLEMPDEGEVYLRGESVTGKPGKIGYMQQSDLLLPFKTVLRNVSVPLLLKGFAECEAYRRSEEILERFSLLEYKDKYPHELSGGMRQRVALARTVLYTERIMLMDEPFSALDAMTRLEMQKWFKEVSREENIATLFITHDINEAIILSDRIYVLGGTVGKIVYETIVEDNIGDETDEKFISLKKDILAMVR